MTGIFGGSGAEEKVPQVQALIRRTGAVTQNQWYDALDVTTDRTSHVACAAGAGVIVRNVRLIGLTLDQATANEDLEIRIIADNVDDTLAQTAVAGTDYYVISGGDPDITTFVTFSTIYLALLVECRKLQIMYRKTTAAGANDTTVKVMFALW